MFKNLSLKVILFGFIFTFFSSFGQSFFLGLFNNSIRNELSITHGQFGSIYASATLLSSFILIWVGKKIDDINISKFAFFCNTAFIIFKFLFSNHIIDKFVVYCNFFNEIFWTRNDVSYCNNDCFKIFY